MVRFTFSELVDIPRLQRLMDLFFKATGIATAVIMRDGSVLTHSGWQDICSRFHRINPNTMQRCLESDTHIANKIESGQKYTLYQCKNGLIDAAVPIVVEGEHVANFFTGQFLLRPPDFDFFRKQAREFGFDETGYLSCVEKLPVMDEARLQPFLEYFSEFAELLSDIGLRQLKQRVIEEQLRTSEARMNRTQEIALLGSWELQMADFRLHWSDQVYRIFGLRAQEFDATYEAFLERVHPDDRAAVDEAYTGSLREGRDAYEIEHRVVRPDGTIRMVHEKCEHIRDASGMIVRSVGMVHDITERKKVEETLKESEQRYRSLFENMLEGYAHCQMIFDEGRPKDFIYCDINPAFETLTGLRNVIGKKVSEVIPGILTTDPELFEIYGRVASTGTPERFERYVEALGMWFSVSVYSPRREYFVAVFDAITERKQAEAALRRTHDELEIRVKERTAELESAHVSLKSEVEERKRTEELIKAARDLSVELSTTSDLTHALELCLDTAFVVSGMDIGGIYLIDQDSGDINLAVHRNLSPELLSAFSHYDKDSVNAQIVRACKPVYTTFQDLGIPDGAHSLRGVAVLPICHEGIAVACLNLGSLKFEKIDPSVRMALEMVALQVGGALLRIQMEEERKRLAAAVEHAAEAVIIVDPTWHIQYVNPAFTSMTGYTQEEAITKELSFLEAENVGHTAYETARQMINTPGASFVSRLARRSKDGSSFPAEASMSSLINDDGNIIGYILLWRDISERVELEEQLRQSHKMQAIGTLAGGIAHDFNNILAAILGFTEMAIEDAANCLPVDKSLQNVRKSALRARDLVRQILAFSRKTTYERAPISLSPLTKETVQLVRASIPANIEIKLSITATSATVLAAPTEVQQIIMNLATNASLAMEEKGGVLEISLNDIDSPVLATDIMAGEYVQLMVKDTGVGMSPEVMKRIFEPFFTTRELGKGTGMGLAVVYGIVTDLGGTITVESESGIGSIFRVFLPKVETEMQEDKIANHQIPRGTENILFVDDEDMLVEWAKAALEKLGYRVLALIDPAEALKEFASNPSHFDLVITDQSMPSMSGMQFARELLTIRPDIPIILCTGHSATVSPEKAKKAGIKEFLMKPVAGKELAHAVRRTLDAYKED